MITPYQGDVFVHYKGGHYYVLGVGTNESDGAPVVIYQPIGRRDTIFVRPLDDWSQIVIHEGRSVVRFRLVAELITNSRAIGSAPDDSRTLSE